MFYKTYFEDFESYNSFFVLPHLPFYLAALGFELRDLRLVGRHSYNLNYALSPFLFSYFSYRVSHFCPRPALNHDPAYTTCVAGITDTVTTPSL
jgi:hypothetical protein